MDYSQEQTNRYVVFPYPEMTREIELNSAIRPGALAQSYTPRWTQLSPRTVLISSNTFDITVNESLSSVPAQYQCRVTIQHHLDPVTYDGPVINIHGRGIINIIHMCMITFQMCTKLSIFSET